jgi:hypothetical protein
MKARKIILVAIACVLVFATGFLMFRVKTPETQTTAITPKPEQDAPPDTPPTNPTTAGPLKSSIRRRVADFSADEKAQFLADFEQRYRPAISNWCSAYDGHLPLAPEHITPDKFVERFSRDTASFGEYVFVVDGITLGVRDMRGTAVVDYLNDPQQTRKMTILPKMAGPPITTLPISRDEVLKILEADSGSQYLAHDVRMKPSGFSGALNGGAFVHIGGDPENSASWKYNLVFGPDSKLAFYLRGL